MYWILYETLWVYFYFIYWWQLYEIGSIIIFIFQMRKLILSKLLRAISQYLVKLALDSRTDAFNHHSVLTPDNQTYIWTSTSIVVEVIEIKTRISSRLTDNFVGFCTSCHTPLFSRHPMLPWITTNCLEDLPSEPFPSRVRKLPSLAPRVFLPQQDSRRQPLRFACYIHSYQYQHLLCCPCGPTSMDRPCHGLPFSYGTLLM